jgi:phage repressor protein C with HTH and peptisase S24 domain
MYKKEFSVNIDWLITGEGEMFDGPRSVAPPANSRANLDQPDFIRLPMYDGVHASAGAGVTPTSEHSSAVLAFERQFLRERGAIPDSCTVIKARGDSMTPTIPDGSLLVVDHSQREVANGYITVVGVGDDLLVKRIRRRLDGMVELISDNAAYAPEVIAADRLEQLRIVGRVIYFCRVP